jgi:drug/metabolite transporter (DMT)-like permease
MLLGSTVLLAPIVFFIEGAPSVSLADEVWTSLIALSLLSTAIAYIIYFEILRRAGSANLMLVTLLIPPVTIALSSTFWARGSSETQSMGLGLLRLAWGSLTAGCLVVFPKSIANLKALFDQRVVSNIRTSRSQTAIQGFFGQVRAVLFI